MTTRDKLSRIAYIVAANAVGAVSIEDLSQPTGEHLVSYDLWSSLTDEEREIVGDYLEEIVADMSHEAKELARKGAG